MIVGVTPSRRGFRNLGRRAIAAMALGTVMIVGAMPAQAAAPVASVTATPGTFKVAIAYRVDRSALAITGQQCTLTAPSGTKTATPCDPTPNPKSTSTSTRYSLTIPLTKAGTYTFKVRFSLTGGLRASASASFAIAPGPAVKLTLSGVKDQDFACVTDSICNDNTYGPDFPRQLAKVTARDRYGNIAKGYTGTVAMERRAGDFPAGIYPPDAKLNKGVGYFPFVAPQAPSAAPTGPCATSDWLLHMLIRFYDKNNPAIQDTCKVIRVRFIIADPAPQYVKVSPPGCVGPCYQDPSGTYIADEGQGPTEIRPAPADWNAPDTALIVGHELDGNYFVEVIRFDARTITVSGGDLGLPVAACPGCEGSQIGVEMADPFIQDTSEIKLVDLGVGWIPPGYVRDPITGRVWSNETKPTPGGRAMRLCPAGKFPETFLTVILSPDLSKCLSLPSTPSRRAGSHRR